MDTSIQRALNDKLYDKRKIGALEYVQNPGLSAAAALYSVTQPMASQPLFALSILLTRPVLSGSSGSL